MFFDSYAWFEYAQETKVGRRVRQYLDEAQVAYACPMVLAEVASKLERAGRPQEAQALVAFIRSQTVVIEHTAAIGLAAGRIHADRRTVMPDFGMADAFILAAARSRHATVLTGDRHFEGLPDAVVLPR